MPVVQIISRFITASKPYGDLGRMSVLLKKLNAEIDKVPALKMR